MHPYVETVRRYFVVLAVGLALIWIPGIISAAHEYLTTFEFESDSTIWVQRTTRTLSSAGENDPSIAAPIAPGFAQAEVFTQLLQTASFLEEVIGRTSLAQTYAAATDKVKMLGDVRKRFRVEVLGTNLIKVSYRASEPGTAAEMVAAALVARDIRVRQSRVAVTTAQVATYNTEYEIAQAQVTVAQAQFDRFNETSAGKRLTATEEYTLTQLRVAVDLGRARVSDLKARIELASLSTTLQNLNESVEFNVIDQPRVLNNPSGGVRSAGTIAGVAIAGGLALIVGVVVLLTLLNDRLTSPGDMSRFAPAQLFAVIPWIPQKGQQPDLRSAMLATLRASIPLSPRATVTEESKTA